MILINPKISKSPIKRGFFLLLTAVFAFVNLGFSQEMATQTYMFCASAPTVADHEGNVYRTVQIGSQCWTAENMRCRTSPSNNPWIKNPVFSAYQPLYDAYYVEPANERYGFLYNWTAAMDNKTQYSKNDGDFVRGICPIGWHLPSANEWTNLFNFLGGRNVAGLMMKAPTNLWEPYIVENRNAGGFDALPAGGFTENGYGNSAFQAKFWSSSSFDKHQAWCAIIYDFKDEINNYLDYKCYGHSVRCVKDY